MLIVSKYIRTFIVCSYSIIVSDKFFNCCIMKKVFHFRESVDELTLECDKSLVDFIIAI